MQEDCHTDILSYAFADAAKHDLSRPLLIDAEDPSRSLSFRELHSLVRKLVAGFRAVGLERGECVLLHLYNNYLYSPLLFGIVGAGGVGCGSDPNAPTSELEHLISLADPRLVITTADLLPTVYSVLERKAGNMPRVYLLDVHTFQLYFRISSVWWGCPEQKLGSEDVAHQYVMDLLCYGEADWCTFSDVQAAVDAPAAYFATSGVTGKLKLAAFSHAALVAQHRSLCASAGPTESTRRLACLPFSNIFTAIFVHFHPLRFAQPLYILPAPDVDLCTAAILQFAITDVQFCPSMIPMLLRSYSHTVEHMRTVRRMMVGGDVMSPNMVQTARTCLNVDAVVLHAWYATEVGIAAISSPQDKGAAYSYPRALGNVELRLTNQEGTHPVGDGQLGQLHVKTRGCMMGYKSGKIRRHRSTWFNTGDAAYATGSQVFVVGRSQDAIHQRGGVAIPGFIEEVLRRHPGIEDAAVLGTSSDEGFQVSRAYVVRRRHVSSSPALTADAVYDYSREQCPGRARLDGGIFFVEQIPRAANGNVQRSKLAEMDRYRQSISSLLFQTGRAPHVTAENRTPPWPSSGSRLGAAPVHFRAPLPART